jgi:hypothetical protein
MQPNGEHAASTALPAADHNHITWYPNIWDQIDIAGSRMVAAARYRGWS